MTLRLTGVVLGALCLLFTQDAPEPVPIPEPLPSVLQVAQPVSRASYANARLEGSTLYEVSGLNGAEIIDGVLVVATAEQQPQLSPFGYVTVTSTEAAEVRISAESATRDPLPIRAFGAGYRIDATGPVWVEALLLYKQVLDINGQQIEVIKSIDQAEVTFEIAGGGDLPDPEPQPGQSPFAEPGLRVLIVYERDQMSELSSDQQAMLFGAPFRQFLRGVTVGSDGWRILDQDTESAGEGSKIWAQAMARNRGDLPWLVVGNGATGYEGPLPDTLDAAREVISRYAQ